MQLHLEKVLLSFLKMLIKRYVGPSKLSQLAPPDHLIIKVTSHNSVYTVMRILLYLSLLKKQFLSMLDIYI